MKHALSNKEVAAVLEEIAMLLELAGENPFKSRSYTNIARAVEGHEDDINTVVAEKRLREIKGVGDALEQKITELVETGELGYHKELRAKFPETLYDLFKIPNLGPKRIKQLYEELNITSLDELEEAANDGRLDGLKGFGKKMQEKVLDGIAFAKQHAGRFLIDTATEEAEKLVEHLRKDKSVIRMEVAGSLRRRRETVHDIDIIASSKDPKKLMKRFVEYDGVQNVTGHGETKSSVVLGTTMAADLRVVTDEQFPYALMHFTGSKEHNIVMRQRAKDRDMKLSEYGLFKGEKLVKCQDETAIYKKLDLPYIPPELREDMGEFEEEEMPDLVEEDELKGVVHCHSTYSDGKFTIEQMAEAAKGRGYKYFGLADHSQTAAYAGGLTPEEVEQQWDEVDKLNKKLKGIKVLKGIESDIRSNGKLDYDKDMLEGFDFIVASVHSKLNMDEKDATARLVKAIEDPHTTILGHPTGRLLLMRDGYPLKWEKIFEACAKNRVAVEINANPRRLDLDWRRIRQAKDKGCMFCIGPDAHTVTGLDDVRWGVGIARKGGLEKGDLLNSLTAKQFVEWKAG